MKAFVLTREASDNSGYYVLRVHLEKARAEQDLSLVEGDYGLTYKLHEVDLFPGNVYVLDTAKEAEAEQRAAAAIAAGDVDDIPL